MAGWLPEVTQESGFLPQTAEQPLAASGSWLPVTSSGPTWGSGATSLATLGQASASLQDSILRYEGSALGQYMRAQQEQTLLNLGLDPSVTDVEDIPTLPADVAKNEAAIAKLATFNPELAEELQRRHLGQPEESKGFFGDMLDTLGDFAAPALAVGAKALELLSRPAQIIPELIVDPEDDAWYQDIGQALSGKSTVQGDDVIRKWFGEDTPGWAQGVAGFAVDVLGDPLTWMTFGMAGVGRATAGAALAKGAGRISLRESVEGGMMHAIDDLDGLANDIVNKMTQATKSGLHEDAIVAEVARSLDQVPLSVVQKMRDDIDPLLRQFNRTGLHRADKATLEKWRPLLERERAILQASGTRAGRQEARALAGALGGTRVVAGVPFTRYRFTSSAVPGSYGFSPFGVPRNFFRGMSGLNRLGKVIDKNTGFLPAQGVREQVYDVFFREGWEGVARNFPVLANELGPGFMGMGSMYRDLSEQVGKMTRKLSNHTQFYRNGDLGALYTMSAQEIGRGRRNAFLDQVVWTFRDENGRVVREGRDVTQYLRDNLDLTNPGKRAAYARFAEVFPGFDKRVLDNLDGYEQELAARLGPDEAAKIRGRIEAAVTDLSPGEIDTILDVRRNWHGGLVAANKNGASLVDRGVSMENQSVLTPEEARVWALDGGGRTDVAEREFIIDVTTPGNLAVKDIKDSPLGRGVYGRTVNPATATSVVRNTVGPVRTDDAFIDELVAKGQVGGFTVDASTGKDATSGWAVATARRDGNEVRIAISDRAAIRKYLRDRASILESDEYHLGGWVDGGDLVLDISRVVKDEAEAVALGRYGQQDAIFNLSTFEEMPLPKTGYARLRLQNPLILGDGTNAEYYQQVVDEVTDSLSKAPFDSALHSVPYDVWLNAQVKKGVTLRLRQEGYDGIVVKNSDDDWEALAFGPENVKDPNARWNVKLTDADAPKATPFQGYFPRILTDEAKQKAAARYGQIPQGKEQVYLHDLSKSHELRRKLEGLDILEANELVKQDLGLSGDAFHLDLLEAHARYGQRLADDVMLNFLQGSGRRLTDFTDRWGVGSAVAVNQYGWRGGAMLEKNLRALSDRHKRIVAQRAEVVARDVERMERHADRYLQEMERLRGEIAQFSRPSGPPGRWVNNPYAQGGGVEPVPIEALAKFREFTRGMKPAERKQVDKIKREFLERGVDEPVWVEYVPGQGAILGEGNHRLKAAEELVAEGHDEFRYLPTRMILREHSNLDMTVRGKTAKFTAAAKTLDAAKEARKGRDVDLRPSEVLEEFGSKAPTMPKSRLGASVRQAKGRGSMESVALGESIERIRTKIRNLEKIVRKTKDPYNLRNQIDELKLKETQLVEMRRRLRTGKTSVDDPAAKQAAEESLAEAVSVRTERITALGQRRERALLKAQQRDAKLAKELDRIRTRYETEAAALVPAMHTGPANTIPAGFERMSEIGLPELAMHPYVAQEFRHALGNKPLNELRRGWRRFIMGPWKTWSTVYYPGFHARNFMGAWFNNMLGGVGPTHYVDAFRVSRALKGDTKWTTTKVGAAKVKSWGLDGIGGRAAADVTYADIGDHLEAMMIRSANSNVAADAFPDAAERVRRLTSQTKVRDKVPAPVRKVATPAKFYGRIMRQTTEVTENLFRTAAYLRGLEVTGGSVVGARAFTMLRHGDYEDLNDYEQFIKDLIPFYKWMRTNIPFQIHTLLEAPGKPLAAMKAQNAFLAASGESPETANKNLPPWVKESFVLALPRGEKGDGLLKYIALDLPMADLYTGANDYISAFLPMVRPFVEAKVFNARMAPGGGTAPIPETAQLGAWASLPGIRQVLEPWITTGADGKEMINGDVQHIMSAIPIFSRFKNWIYADEKAQSKRAATFWSAVTGVRPEDITEEELTAAEKAFYYEELLPLINTLKDLGVSLPEKPDIDPSVFEALGLNPPEEEDSATSSPLASAFGG